MQSTNGIKSNIRKNRKEGEEAKITQRQWRSLKPCIEWNRRLVQFSLMFIKSRNGKTKRVISREQKNRNNRIRRWTSGRAFNIDIRAKFVTQMCLDGFLKIIFVKSEENDSDIFTKNLPSELHQRHARKLVVHKENNG